MHYSGGGGGVPAQGVYLPGGVHLPRGEGVPAQRGVPDSGACWDTYTPPVNRMTDRCKNITLPQTSFAAGNNW